uniref:Uncharacterized protein n=1 Tax=Anguilla anguilla TaxID=7936 RepID=A0A0E9XM76_ANGAN
METDIFSRITCFGPYQHTHHHGFPYEKVMSKYEKEYQGNVCCACLHCLCHVTHMLYNLTCVFYNMHTLHILQWYKWIYSHHQWHFKNIYSFHFHIIN